jgi:hypothetical protein
MVAARTTRDVPVVPVSPRSLDRPVARTPMPAACGLAEHDWPPMPESHRIRLRHVVSCVPRHDELVGLLAGGSFVAGRLDRYSDLDLIVVTAPHAWPGILERRTALAAEWGPLLGAFPGDHVGEPRLLICLYGPPLVHVDLKFLTPDQLGCRVEDPVVLWARDASVASGLAAGRASYPRPDLQWIEDRFWIWVHYAATKIGRGELFEALGSGAFVRSRVLGPLALDIAGARPDGVRRLEQTDTADAAAMRQTVAAYDARDIVRAVSASVDLYRSLRDRIADATLERHPEAEAAAVAYLEDVARTLGHDPDEPVA